jgi:hypothetical protein
MMSMQMMVRWVEHSSSSELYVPLEAIKVAEHIFFISHPLEWITTLCHHYKPHVHIQVGGEALADNDDEEDDSEAGDQNPALNEEEEDDYDSGYESLDKDLLKTFYFVCPPKLRIGDDWWDRHKSRNLWKMKRVIRLLKLVNLPLRLRLRLLLHLHLQLQRAMELVLLRKQHPRPKRKGRRGKLKIKTELTELEMWRKQRLRVDLGVSWEGDCSECSGLWTLWVIEGLYKSDKNAAPALVDWS